MHTLFTTVKSVPQSQQIRAKKKKSKNVKEKRGRGAQTSPLTSTRSKGNTNKKILFNIIFFFLEKIS